MGQGQRQRWSDAWADALLGFHSAAQCELSRTRRVSLACPWRGNKNCVARKSHKTARHTWLSLAGANRGYRVLAVPLGCEAFLFWFAAVAGAKGCGCWVRDVGRCNAGDTPGVVVGPYT